MKQALIDGDGLTVTNVRIMPVGDDGEVLPLEGDTYSGPTLLLADDHYCGVGMVWDGDESSPLFTYPADLASEKAGVWSWVRAKLGVE